MANLGSETDPASLFDLGNAMLEGGAPEAAITAFKQCRLIVPDHAGVCYNLGNALLQGGRTVEAVEALVDCVRLAPGFGAAYVNLANALRQLTLLEQAREMAELAVRHLPELPEANLGLANVLHDQAYYAQAAGLYWQVLEQAPDHAGALSSLGNTLCAMGQSAQALAMHDRAVIAAPHAPEFRFNRAVALLASGDYARGWDEYEQRWQHLQSRPRGFGPAWQGEDVTGRTILLHAEQGLGDTLQFVRYVTMVAQRGAHVVLEVQPSLVKLMRCLPCTVQVVARGDTLPPFDMHCPLLSLPRVFSTTVDTIPNDVPYLRADPASAVAWRVRLPAEGLRVGVVWAGSPHADDAGASLINQRRSLDPSALTVLGGIGGVHMVSLQKDQPDVPPSVVHALRLINPMPEIADFADTAALVASLDLVISVDTSVAHLAGAMGRPVWLLSRYDGCWRWLKRRNDSPWYPGMRIYRQGWPHDWTSVLRQVRSDLAALAGEASRVYCSDTDNTGVQCPKTQTASTRRTVVFLPLD